MFFIRRPSRHIIDGFLDRSRNLALTYEPIGIARDPSAGRNYDEAVVTIGHGAEDFERAREALAGWRQFEMDWVELAPRGASHQPGAIVAVLIRHLGFWSLNGARVVYNAGDRQRGNHFAVAYGTLTNHAERGEEIFEVSLDPDSGEVTYRIRAASWPRAFIARAGYPIVRALQAKFRRESANAMRRAVHGSDAP